VVGKWDFVRVRAVDSSTGKGVNGVKIGVGHAPGFMDTGDGVLPTGAITAMELDTLSRRAIEGRTEVAFKPTKVGTYHVAINTVNYTGADPVIVSFTIVKKLS
jgi:hypothetical protein